MKKLVYFVMIGLLVGCSPKVGVKVTVVDTKTQLENQITGTYSALEEQAWMVASVRGEEGNKELMKYSVSERQVFQAMNSRKYYADDIADFMAAGCLGEGNEGMVVGRSEGCTRDSKADTKLISELKDKENEARRTIMGGIVSKNLNLDGDDMPSVREAFAKKRREEAKAGWWVESAEGNWSKLP
jgi:hypothetical protein